MADPTFPTDERSQSVPSFTVAVLRYKFSRVSDSFRERSRGKRFQNVFYLRHRTRWCHDPRQGWKKRGDRFAVERRGNKCGTRPTIIGTFPLTSRNGERGTHMARREGTIEEISPITQWLLCLFLFRLDFHTIFPPDYIYIYIYPMYLFLTFVSHDEIFFSKVFEPSNLDRQANYGKEEVIPIINEWGLTIWNSISLSLDFSSDRGTIRSFSHLFGNNARR